MLIALWVLIIGLYFMVTSVFMRSVGPALTNRKLIPATRAHKIYFFVIGLIIFIKGVLMVWAAMHT